MEIDICKIIKELEGGTFKASDLKVYAELDNEKQECFHYEISISYEKETIEIGRITSEEVAEKIEKLIELFILVKNNTHCTII